MTFDEAGDGELALQVDHLRVRADVSLNPLVRGRQRLNAIPANRDGAGFRQRFFGVVLPNCRSGILAGGNWIIDRVKMVDAYPGLEQLANIKSQHMGTGGSPYNVLLDLAKLGVEFPLMGAGLVGKDALGAAIVEDCAKHKIDTRHLKATAEADTSYTDVFTVQSNGKRTFFHYRGANALWDGKDLDFSKIKARKIGRAHV